MTEKKAETSKAAEEITENVESTQGENPVQTKPLIVYLNDFDDVIADMFKEATGYDVEVVSGNSAEIMSRIAAEKEIHSGMSYGSIPCMMSITLQATGS